jgi:dUTP pyrophosphatase
MLSVIGLTVLGAPQIVETNYRSEVQVILANSGRDDFSVKRGALIAKLILTPIVRAGICEVSTLEG